MDRCDPASALRADKALLARDDGQRGRDRGRNQARECARAIRF